MTDDLLIFRQAELAFLNEQKIQTQAAALGRDFTSEITQTTGQKDNADKQSAALAARIVQLNAQKASAIALFARQKAMDLARLDVQISAKQAEIDELLNPPAPEPGDSPQE